MLKKILYIIIKIIGRLLSNSQYSTLLFWYNTKRLKKEYYQLDFKNPKTFNEKICFIKFYVKNKLSVVVADKIAVRGYIEKKIGKEFLIPLLKTYNSVDEIDFNELPNKFVMKLNNGSGYNLICNDKNRINQTIEIEKFRNALQTDIYLLSREWHYKEIKPQILVEELLEFNLNDYKFFCNQDGPFMVQIDIDRFTNHRRNIYNLNWELMPMKIRYENASYTIEKPLNFEKMIELAKKISSDFVFCRVDLYEHNNCIYFGEVTLHPGGGVEPFDSYQSDLKMGSYIKL